MENHSERAHALLSASGANRWINCPLSPRIEDLFPDEESDASAEGTLAHEFAEIEQLKFLKRISLGEYNTRLAELRTREFYSPEMEEYVDQFVEYVLAYYFEAKSNKVTPIEVYVETRLDLTKYIPEGFGTSDDIVLIGRTLHVFDLKYGYLRVNAVDNKQLRIYALGAYEKLNAEGFEIENVVMHIVQPRIGNFASDEILIDELLFWADTDLKMFAERAFNGEGGQHAGEHCQFCKATHSCAELAREATTAIELMKEPSDFDLLTMEEKTELYLKIPLFNLWASAFETHMTETAQGGVKYSGLKVVEGTTRRVIKNEKQAERIIVEAGFDRELIIEEKLIPLGKLEKFIGKKESEKLLKPVIFKPRGKAILVPESDKRQPYADDSPESVFGAEPLED